MELKNAQKISGDSNRPEHICHLDFYFSYFGCRKTHTKSNLRKKREPLRYIKRGTSTRFCTDR
jgi:hypothetical protein